MKKLLFFFFLTAALNPLLSANMGVLKGFVHDKSTNEVLEYATVMAYTQKDKSLSGGAVTDMRGLFEIPLEYGKYDIVIQFVGYHTLHINDVVVDRETLNMGKVLLEPDNKLLDEVEVRAERSTMEMTLDRRVFNVGKDLTSTTNNAIELLENIPSVTVDVEGNVSLRGDEGVQILIDGKESGLVGMSTKDALNTLQADMIDKIEIITNPSVRYDAEGTAGIINIVLKKDKRHGFNGNIDLQLGYPLRVGGGMSANYRIKKFNFFANVNANYSKSDNDAYTRTTYFDGAYDDYMAGNVMPYKFSEQFTNRTMIRNGQTVRFGTEYSFSDNESISASVMLRNSKGHNNPLVEYYDSVPNSAMNYSTRSEEWHSNRPVREFSVNYLKRFAEKDHKLTAEARYFTNSENEWSDISEVIYTDVNATDTVSELLQGTDVVQEQDNIQLTVDYERPVGRNGKFEAGAKFTSRNIHKINNITQADTLLSYYSYDFNYLEDIGAAYMIYGNDFGRFSFQGGLRAEYTYTDPQLADTLGLFAPTQQQKYINLFPSGHVNYKLTESDQLQVSYTRRIRRPHYHQINPIGSFNDNRNIHVGNPNLKPVFTDSYELSYLRFDKLGSYSFTTYYRHSENPMRRYTWLDSVTEISYTTPLNFGTDNNFGFEVTANIQIKKWWSVNGNFNFFRSITTGTIDGKTYNTDTYHTGGRLVSKFTFKRVCDLQVTANFRGPHDEPLGRHNGVHWIDVAASKDIMHGQGTLTLNVRDLFETRGHRGESWGYGFTTYSTRTWRPRSINLNFNYRINQKKSRRPAADATMGEEVEEMM